MKPINQEFKPIYGNKIGSREYSVIDGYINGLKGLENVECIYMRYDNAGPGCAPYIYITAIVDGDKERVNELKHLTEMDLEGTTTRFKYGLIVSDLNELLNMEEGRGRTLFRMGLASLYTDFLLDRQGYFSALRDEIIRKAGVFQTATIPEFESLGDLETEKQATRIFKPRKEE